MDAHIKKVYVPMTETSFYILLCLRTPNHGYGIVQKVKELTDNEVVLGPGTMMVPTTVVMTVPVAETMKDQRLRNRITAEMTTVVETPAETKAVAETSLTKAVEMTVERLQRRQALLMLLKFIKIRR